MKLLTKGGQLIRKRVSLLFLTAVLASSSHVNAQILWSSSSGTDWLTGGNWTGGSVPSGSQSAMFNANPTSATTGVGINMSGSTNNGTNNQAVGAIIDSSVRTGNIIICNSSTSDDGTLTLNGVTYQARTNTILANTSTAHLILTNNTAGTGGNKLMNVFFGSTAKNILAKVGNTTAPGSTINIISNLSGSGPLTFIGNGNYNGTANNYGGLLRLGGNNSFTGGITVGASATINGFLQLDTSNAIASATGNNINILANSQLILNAENNATFTTALDTLFLNSRGPLPTLAYSGRGALFVNSKSYTWPGTIVSGTANTTIGLYGGNGYTFNLTGNYVANATVIDTLSPGTGTTYGNVFDISGNLSGASTRTLLGGGTWNGTTGIHGGLFRWGGNNTNTGLVTVGQSAGTNSSGILELYSANAVTQTSITVQPFSQVLLNAPDGSSYNVTPATNTLTLNGSGPSPDFPYSGKGALFCKNKTLTWPTNISINAANGAYISSIGSASRLILSGSITLSGTLSDTTSAGTSTDVGAIIEETGVLSSTGTHNILGGGTWNGYSGNMGGVVRLSGVNTFTGATNVGKSDGTSGGILETNGSAIAVLGGGTAHSIFVNNNSQLFINSTTGTAFTSTSTTLNLNGFGFGNNNYTGRGAIFVKNKSFSMTYPIVISSPAMITGVGTINDSLRIGGATTLNSALTDSAAPGTSTAPGYKIIHAAAIGGTGAFTFLGGGTWNGTTGNNGGVLKLVSNNTYSGGLTIGKSDGSANGIVELFSANSVSTNAANSITVNTNSQLAMGIIANYPAISNIILNGHGSNTTAFGPGALSAPTTGGAIGWATPITVNSSATIADIGSSGTMTVSGALTQNADLRILAGMGTSTGIGSTIKFTNSMSGTGADSILGNGTWDGSTGNNGGLVIWSGANTRAGKTIIGRPNGTQSAILELDAANSVSNDTLSSIFVHPNSQLYLASTVTPATFATSNITLNLSGNGNNYSTTGVGALFAKTATNFTWTGPVNLMSDATIGTIGTSVLILSGNIGGSAGLTKSGPGTLTINNSANTYTGQTTVSQGTLNVQSGTSLPATTSLVLAGKVAGSNITVNLNNATQTLAGLSSNFAISSGTLAQGIVLSTGHILTLNMTGSDTFGVGSVGTLTSSLSGAGTLIKDGSGTLTLTTKGGLVSGGIKIHAGELRLNPSGTMTITAPDTLDGGTLSTVGDTAITGGNATITLNTLNLTASSSINLETDIVHSLKFSASSSIPWAPAATLTVRGWRGTINGTSAGTKGRLFVGTNTSGLSAGQLAQIIFIDQYGATWGATQITGGEIVPKPAAIVTGGASYGPYCIGSPYGISVSFTSSGPLAANFKVQLSDASGNFASDTTTNIIGQGVASPISATLPDTVSAGSGYRVRVINGNPQTYGSNNGSNISFSAPLSPGTISSNVLTMGGSAVLTCTPGGGTWSTSNSSVASINASTGTVYGVGLGTCNISYAVSNVCGTFYSTISFNVVSHPNVTSVTPLTAKVGDTINISGLYFNATPANNLVRFGTSVGRVLSTSTTTSLDVILDTSAFFGPVEVVNNLNHLNGYSKEFFLPTYRSGYFIRDSINMKGKVDFAVGAGPNIVGAGDLDGDGKPDLIAVNSDAGAGNTITVYRNTSTPGSLVSSSFTLDSTRTAGAAVSNVKVADLDGDNRPELIVSNAGSASVSIFKNTSSGIGNIAFAPKRDVNTISSAAIGAQPLVIAIADYDNDGKPDIAVSSGWSASNSISILRNQTTYNVINGSSFAAPVSFFTATKPIGLVSGDFDGDGLPDLAAACTASNVVSVLLNTSSPGNISFATHADLASGDPSGAAPLDVNTGDIDGDGKLDILVSNSDIASQTFSVFRNTSSTGSLSFATHFDFATGFNAVGVGLADMNGDSKLDVVVANAGNNSISVYRNTATSGVIDGSTFAARRNFTTGLAPAGLNVVDLDGDGYPDVAVANKGVSSFSVIRNYPLPYIPPISGTLSVCEAGGTTALSDSVTGGWWSLFNTRATIDPVTGVVTGVTAGVDTVYYSVVAGGDTNTIKAVLTIKPLPTVPAIGGPSGVCPADSVQVTNDTTGGIWGITNASLATISSGTGMVHGITPGLDTVTYTVTVIGCSRTVSRQITINTPPVAGVVSGPGTVCVASLGSFSVTGGDIGGTWSTSSSSLATINAATGQLYGVAAGNVMVTYSSTNSCGTAFDTIMVTILPLGDTGIITGANSVCVGATTALADTAAGGVWSSSNTSIATISSSGVITGLMVGSVSISYTVTNFCGANSAVIPFNVLTVPATPAAITGANNVCSAGGTISLSDATPSGTWSSSNASVASVDASGMVTAGSVGSAVITYTVSNSCGSSYVTHPVNVVASPTAIIASAVAPCIGYSTNVIYNGTTGDTIGYKVDGGSVVTGVVSGGTFSFSTGAISSPHTYTLYSVTNAGCAVVINQDTIITPTQLTWVGGNASHESEWGVTANWSCGVVPGASDNIIIPTGLTYYPILTATDSVTVNGLTLGTGASVTLNALAVMNVKGSLVNNGAVSGAGSFKLNNTTAQSISGIGTIESLELNNTSGAIISAASKVTIGRLLKVTEGTLTTNDSLVLNSDSTATARVAPIGSGGLITGTVKVMQYIPGGMRRYRFWSHPFSNYIGLSQVLNYIDVTGAGGPTNGFTYSTSSAPSAFRYDPNTGNSNLGYDPGWKPFTSAYTTADSNRLHRWQGIRIYMRGAKGEGLDYIAYTPSPVTIGQWGTLNQGDQTVPLQKGTSTFQEYNMIGNPYASPVDIGTVCSNAKVSGNIVGGAFYVWNAGLGAAGQYQAIGITTVSPTPYYLQANSCFQVRAANNGDTLNFTENNKGTTPTSSLFRSTNDGVRLMVYDNNYHPWDMLDIQFNDQAGDEDDNNNDAVKVNGSDFNFYTIASNNSKLSIDVRAFRENGVIPIGINSHYAQDFIIRTDLLNIGNSGNLYLHDKLLNQYVLLTKGSEYKFSVSNDAKSQGDNRFELKMAPAEAVNTTDGLNVTIQPNPAREQTVVSFTANGKDNVEMNIIDLTGVNVFHKQLGVKTSGSVTVPLDKIAAGLYLIEVSSGGSKVIQKLVKE